MWWLYPVIISATPVQEVSEPLTDVPVPIEDQTLPEEMEDCQKGIEGLKNDVRGVEVFLKDKKEYKEHCPLVKWEQPKLDKYKKEPKSYLPEDCIVEETP